MSISFGLSLAMYLTLCTAILLHWFKQIRLLWVPIFLLSVILALLSKRLDLIGLGFILIYASVAYSAFYLKNRYLRNLSELGLFVFSIAFILHKVPGFSNWLLISNVRLSPNSTLLNLYLNFDKGLVGLFILGFGGFSLVRTQKEWGSLVKQAYPFLLLGIPLIALFAIYFHLIAFSIKATDYFLPWAFSNLILVCIVEEVFFRGFVLKRLVQLLKPTPLGNYIALLISSIVFMLCHSSPCLPKTYVLFSGLAGLFYGWIYLKTKRLEASILAHFSLNTVHFLLFTYPLLRTA